MPLKINAKLSGFAEAGKKLQQLDYRTRTEVLEIAARAAGVLLMFEVYKRVPVETGHLYRSMRYQVLKSPDEVKLALAPQPGYAHRYHGRMEDPQEYGELVEEHGSPIGRGKRFMRDSVEAAAEDMKRTIAAIIKAAIEGKVAGQTNIPTRPVQSFARKQARGG